MYFERRFVFMNKKLLFFVVVVFLWPFVFGVKSNGSNQTTARDANGGVQLLQGG